MSNRVDVREPQIRTSLADFTQRIIGPSLLIEEFWVPRSHERADMVALTPERSYAFEIKSARDSLHRLPRQQCAYEKLFDYCSVVVAERHAAKACEMLPEWWGVYIVESHDEVAVIKEERSPELHDMIDENLLVRLLWKAEAAALIPEAGDEGLRRPVLWRRILEKFDVDTLRISVLSALIARDFEDSRF
jgi:hypothetical protein